VVEHSIGNGEVDSSILSGSTIFRIGFFAFQKRLRPSGEQSTQNPPIFSPPLDGSSCCGEATGWVQKIKASLGLH
jgi:hypothetical protein